MDEVSEERVHLRFDKREDDKREGEEETVMRRDKVEAIARMRIPLAIHGEPIKR